jgi:hypothetical protein
MRKLLLTLPLLLLCSLPALSQKIRLITPGQVEIDALRGLESMTVEVNSEVPRKGYDSETIKTASVKRLQAEGVPVVGPDKPSKARLVITLLQYGDVVLIRVQLMRFASLMCDRDVFYTPMWEREYFSRFGKDDLLFDVSFAVDTFGADYNNINRR